MKILRYVILILLLCNIPGIVLVNFGDAMGSNFSYLMYCLALGYFIITKPHKIAWPFIIFVISFYCISGLSFINDEKYFLFDFFKAIIIILGGSEIARRTSLNELFFFLSIGISTILLNALFFPMDFGRYSGFYLDPNSAGFACLLGCSLSFFLPKKWKLLALFFCTFCGILTFSRTFFLMWFIINLIAIVYDKKNITGISLGIASLVVLLSIAALLKLNTERLEAIENIVNNSAVNQTVNEDSRVDTWARYYEKIYEAPFIGHGYQTFTGRFEGKQGVHNNYLRIIGESGIIPLLIFLGIHMFLLWRSIIVFNTKGYPLLIVISLLALHLTNHNFDSIAHVILITLWVYYDLKGESLVNIEEHFEDEESSTLTNEQHG